jgi:undecaprenyl-diphosphatase
VAVPFAQRIAPQVRFAWERFTPGGLGLEFTSAVAILMTGAYTFYFFLVTALDFPNSDFANRLNDAAFRVCDSLRTDWLDSIAQFVTNFGALWCVGPLVLLVAGYCLWRRRVPETVVLLVSLIVTVIVVNATKNWTKVPRPPDPLTSTSGWSFPSGHSAYAVSYVAIAISLHRIGGIFTKVTLTTVALVLASAVGLSRVYLRAHYLTDVIGGVALAFLSASLFTAIAMLIVHVHSIRSDERTAATAESADPADKVA